ncbi:MAG TPA: hypothetical protein VMW72_11490 [Sedimentisphaerales bacterium]|nr:hypothetical protein [Sedimentisphaerales bacterium]
MPIEPWLPILKWKDIPRFFEIHDLAGTARFMKLYHHDDPMLEAFIADLLEGLTGTNPEPAVRIESPRGWGKTSCFYFLMEHEKVRGRFHHQVIHAGRFIGSDGIDTGATFRTLFEAVYGYLKECAPESDFVADILDNQDLNNYEKLNEFLKYIIATKTRLTKKLVLVIDDVDHITDEKHVLAIAVEVFKMLQQAPIIKWLAVRNVTYRNYSEETKKDIDTLFPIVYPFPNVSLSDIVKIRVSEVSGPDRINPFSPRLCQVIQQLHYGDHRKGLAILKQLLLANPPKGIKLNTAEGFIQRHIERGSIRVLLREESLPNVFTASGNVNTVLPLPLEILQLASYRRKIDDEFIGLVKQSLASKVDPGDRTRKELIQISKEDMIAAAVYLENIGIIEFNGDRIRLTEKGRITQRYAEQEYYYDVCCDLLKDTDTKHEIFWKLVLVGSTYGPMLRDKLLGQDNV